MGLLAFILVTFLCSAQAAFLTIGGERRRLLPLRSRNDQGRTTTAAVQERRLLVLWKGGAGGNADEGNSLACLRQSEFRGLATRLLGISTEEARQISFEDALIADVGRAAGMEHEDRRGEAPLVWVGGALPAEALRQIVSRAMLIRAAYEVIAVASTWQACGEAVNAMSSEDPQLRVLFEGAPSWSARLEVFGTWTGRHKSTDDLPQKLLCFRRMLEALPGPVNLKTPNVSLVLFEDGDVASRENLHQVFLTRELCRGVHGLTHKLSLKTRAYVTTTSMESKTSLVMANVAGVAHGDAVLDPYAGSGGLLLAAAQFGAGTTVGIDINSTIDVSRVHANFLELGLPVPREYIFGDAADDAVIHRAAVHGPYDVILADPPYGKREKGNGRAEAAAEEATWNLMRLAADNRILKPGGRMTFFVPSHPSLRDVRTILPSHKCLRVVDAARQRLHLNLERWLITVHKMRDAQPGEKVEPPTAEDLALATQALQQDPSARERRIWHYTGVSSMSPEVVDGG